MPSRNFYATSSQLRNALMNQYLPKISMLKEQNG